MRRIVLLAVLLLLGLPAWAFAQTVVTPCPIKAPLKTTGAAVLSTTDTSALLSSVTGGIPANTEMAVGIVATNAINYSTSGTPTQTAAPTVGLPVSVGQVVVLCRNQLTPFRAINQTSGSNGQINFEFYGY